MGRFHSKAKGGAYELTICRKLASAFKPLGIKEDDCYRTKNSGATKSQPGDIQLSPRFAKCFPVLIECKHYRSVQYKLGKILSQHNKSNLLLQWWKQVLREKKQSKNKNKISLLIFRQNQCPDLVLLKEIDYATLCGGVDSIYLEDWVMHTRWKQDKLLMFSFDFFLGLVVEHAQLAKKIRIGSKRIIRRGK